MRRLLFYALQNHEEDPQINLTPLIDVVFVILIMFMLLAPLLEMEQIHLASASPSCQELSLEESSRPHLKIYVRSDNSIWAEKQQVSAKQLLSWLEQEKKRHPEKKVLLFQDKNASFGSYQEVKRCAETAGFEEMDLVLQPG